MADGPLFSQESTESLERAQLAMTATLHKCLMAEMEDLVHFPTMQLRHVPPEEQRDCSAPSIPPHRKKHPLNSVFICVRGPTMPCPMRAALRSMALHSCLQAEIHQLIHFPTFHLRHVEPEQIRDRSQPIIQPGIALLCTASNAIGIEHGCHMEWKRGKFEGFHGRTPDARD
eukprot:1194231-Prorocentrum_minimum.AAC.3